MLFAYQVYHVEGPKAHSLWALLDSVLILVIIAIGLAIFPRREAINSGSSGQGFWCNVAAKDVVMALTELGI